MALTFHLIRCQKLHRHDQNSWFQQQLPLQISRANLTRQPFLGNFLLPGDEEVKYTSQAPRWRARQIYPTCRTLPSAAGRLSVSRFPAVPGNHEFLGAMQGARSKAEHRHPHCPQLGPYLGTRVPIGTFFGILGPYWVSI